MVNPVSTIFCGFNKLQLLSLTVFFWTNELDSIQLIAGSKLFRGSLPEVFLGKVVLKICSIFTGQHPCRSLISINLLNLLHIFRTPFPKSTSEALLLIIPVTY